MDGSMLEFDCDILEKRVWYFYLTNMPLETGGLDDWHALGIRLGES